VDQPNTNPNPDDTGSSRRDPLAELQARVEAALDEVRPKIKRALEELDQKVDAAVAEIKPRAKNAMKEVQPKVDQFVADVQPRLDSLLQRLSARIDELRRDLDERAARTGGRDDTTPAGQLGSGSDSSPPPSGD